MNTYPSAAHCYTVLDPIFKDSTQFKSNPLSEIIGGTVVLKLESLNPIGSFKGRGTDYLFHQRKSEFRSGIVAASAGNFGQGLAYCAAKHGVQCTVFAPLTANSFKIERMQHLGAEVILAGDDFDEAKTAAQAYAREKDKVFIEDGKEAELCAGAGTIAYELAKSGVTLDSILVPLGNGSLMNGIAKTMSTLAPATRVIGVCAAGAPAMAQSYKAKSFTQTDTVSTIADGVAVRIPVNEALPDLYKYAADVITVSDSEIENAMKFVFAYHRLLIEPAGAVGVAALLSAPSQYAGKSVATLLCGSNLTPEQIRSWIL